jgi:hypothetical protein
MTAVHLIKIILAPNGKSICDNSCQIRKSITIEKACRTILDFLFLIAYTIKEIGGIHCESIRRECPKQSQ